MSRKQFSVRLRQLRAEHKVTQAQAAQRVNASITQWMSWERPTGNAEPSIEHLCAIAEGFTVSLDWLLCGREAARGGMKEARGEISTAMSALVRAQRALDPEDGHAA